MRRVIVRYRVKPDQVARNEELVKAVYEELARVKPDGFRYATFKLEDGVSFVHVASGEFPLGQLEAFRAFTAGIAERCEEPPKTDAVELVGSYGL